MKTALYIAWRYLFAKKSHNVINVISAISAAGMAIGSAALILILSVYNGFSSMIEDNLSRLDPEVLITSESGAFFVPDSSMIEQLENDPRVRSFNCIIEDNIFFTYGDEQGIARARGVEYGYEIQSEVKNLVTEGEFALYKGDLPQAAVSADLAWSKGIHPRFVDHLRLYYPDGDKPVSIMNPTSSLNSSKVWPCSLINVNKDLIIVPLATMQELTGDDNRLSGIEVRLVDKRSSKVRSYIKSPGFDGPYRLKDRYQQNTAVFKMIKYEKFAIYMILIFVVVIVAFNIFGSLSMLMIEKTEDMESLRAMGASEPMIRRIFLLEGWMVSMVGMIAGVVIGLILTLLQQRTGMVSVPGMYPPTPYPAEVSISDILLTCAGVGTIGFMTAFFKSGYGRR